MVEDITAKRPPVGRGRKVREAVLAATLLELTDHGFAALTVEAVAQRAGVNKTTVYRRWGDRQALVADTIIERMAADLPIPDTGGVETDLLAFASSLIELLTSPAGQAIMNTMLVGAAHVPEIVALRQRFFDDRLHRAAPMVTRAIERGELPAGIDPAAVIKTLIGPVYLRLLVTSEPLSRAVAERAVRVTLAAARAGALEPELAEAPQVSGKASTAGR